MIWTITKCLIVIISLILIIKSIYEYNYCKKNNITKHKSKVCSRGELIFCIVSYPICTFAIGLVICAIICMTINVNAKVIEVEKYTTSIYCLNDSSKIEGRSYLYSGYIKENMVYRTIYLDNHGGKRMWEINANQSSVFEDGNNKVTVYGEKFENPKIEYLMEDWSNLKHETRYEIHIPKGSITTDYKIDLQ